jgi:chaperonin GroEL
MLDDLAVITGATVISSETNTTLKDATLDMLGTAGRIVCSKDATTIVRGGGSKAQIQERADLIRAELNNTDSSYDAGKLKERLAYLVGGVAVIMVGASTEVETKELTHRIEDASRNAKAAVEEGIVAGGGVALPQAARLAADDLSKLELAHDVRLGVSLVVEAVKAPLKQIAKNAGYEPGVVENKIHGLPVNYGLNALNGEYVDMIKARIIDPKKVARCAVQNAASIAGLLLTTDAIVVKKPEKSSAEKAGAPGMGGMGDVDM